MKPISERAVGFAFPGSLDTPTGGFRYDRRLVAELRALGVAVEPIALPGAFPDPGETDLAAAECAVQALAAGTPIIIDGLAYAVMPEIAARLAATRPIIALVHHPLALESGLTADRSRMLAASERAALAHAHRVIVTSPATADILVADYGVPRARIAVALPGVDRPPAPRPGVHRPARPTPGPVRLLSVGSLIPRKGHLDLIAALSGLRDLAWHAEIVGNSSLDPPHAAAISSAIEASGLQGRITVTGALTAAELDARYGKADCFVLASHYEGYGMAYTEAIAVGLPVIGTTGAADAIGDGGIMIAPGDGDALAAALRQIIGDAEFRAHWSARAMARAARYPTWIDTARIVAETISAVVV